MTAIDCIRGACEVQITIWLVVHMLRWCRQKRIVAQAVRSFEMFNLPYLVLMERRREWREWGRDVCALSTRTC